MRPAIRPADILLIRAVEVTRVAVGDVVLFAREGRLFAHRVVETHAAPHVLITRGDAHSHHDPPVAASLLLGRAEGLLRHGTAGPFRPVPLAHLKAGVSTSLFRRLVSIRACLSKIPSTP
jgi:hypothetical protein